MTQVENRLRLAYMHLEDLNDEEVKHSIEFMKWLWQQRHNEPISYLWKPCPIEKFDTPEKRKAYVEEYWKKDGPAEKAMFEFIENERPLTEQEARLAREMKDAYEKSKEEK